MFEVNTGNRTSSDYLANYVSTHAEALEEHITGGVTDKVLTDEELVRLTDHFDFGGWTTFCVKATRKLNIFRDWRRNNLQHAATALIQQADYERVESAYCSAMGIAGPLERNGRDHRFIWDLLNRQARHVSNGKVVLSPDPSEGDDWARIQRAIQQRVIRHEAAPVEAVALAAAEPDALTPEEEELNRLFAADSDLAGFRDFLDQNGADENHRTNTLKDALDSLLTLVADHDGSLRMPTVDATPRARQLHTALAYAREIDKHCETARGMTPKIPEPLFFAKMMTLFEDDRAFALGNVTGENRQELVARLDRRLGGAIGELTTLATEIAGSLSDGYTMILQAQQELAKRESPFALFESRWMMLDQTDFGAQSETIVALRNSLSTSANSPWRLALKSEYHSGERCLENLEILDQIYSEVVGTGEGQISQQLFRAAVRDAMRRYNVVSTGFGGVEDSRSVAGWIREVCRGLAERSEWKEDPDAFGRVLLDYVADYHREGNKTELCLKMNATKSQREGRPVIDIQKIGNLDRWTGRWQLGKRRS